MNTVVKENSSLVNQQFLEDVLAGLAADSKYLSAKYFYDEKGDVIFQQIMNMDEYYLTNSEMEILKTQADSICKTIAKDGDEFDLIELGAGDATKSIHLLKKLKEHGFNFSYLPIDISSNMIDQLGEKLPLAIPSLNIKGFNGDYFEMLMEANSYSTRRKVVLFMGANIGNMTVEEAKLFCNKLHANLSIGDLLIIGFDLKKNPKQILDAYNDKSGITKAFNLNLLDRINNELDGDFDLANFDHYAFYNPETGECKSYLISLTEQDVSINNQIISFKENEHIYMEISQKYNIQDITSLCEFAGFSIVQNFNDQKRYFIDSIWKVK